MSVLLVAILRLRAPLVCWLRRLARRVAGVRGQGSPSTWDIARSASDLSPALRHLGATRVDVRPIDGRAALLVATPGINRSAVEGFLRTYAHVQTRKGRSYAVPYMISEGSLSHPG